MTVIFRRGAQLLGPISDLLRLFQQNFAGRIEGAFFHRSHRRLPRRSDVRTALAWGPFHAFQKLQQGDGLQICSVVRQAVAAPISIISQRDFTDEASERCQVEWLVSIQAELPA